MNTAIGATKGNKVPVLMKTNTAHFICKTQHSSGDTWLHVFKSTLRNIEPERRRGECDFFSFRNAGLLSFNFKRNELRHFQTF